MTLAITDITIDYAIKSRGKMLKTIALASCARISKFAKLSSTASARSFKILGIQQIAIGSLDKEKLNNFWVDLLGIKRIGYYVSKVIRSTYIYYIILFDVLLNL